MYPRVKYFLWRVCTNTLPTVSNLYRRGVSRDPMCPRCGEAVETQEHAILDCERVSVLWKKSALRLDVSKWKNWNLRMIVWDLLEARPGVGIELFAMTAQEIWNARNKWVFEKKETNDWETLERASRRWNEYQARQMEQGKKDNMRNSKARWKKPTQGKLKLNCDFAALSESVIGIGYVIRDDEGKVKMAGRAQMKVAGNSTLLEGVALRYALTMAKQHGLKIEQTESDNQGLIDGINGRREVPVYCDIIVEDILRLAMEVECKSFEAIPRQANTVAHHASRLPDFCSFDRDPSLFRHFLQADVQP